MYSSHHHQHKRLNVQSNLVPLVACCILMKDWTKQLQRLNPRGFDVVIDSAGGEGFGSLIRLLGMGDRPGIFGGTAGKWYPHCFLNICSSNKYHFWQQPWVHLQSFKTWLHSFRNITLCRLSIRHLI